MRIRSLGYAVVVGLGVSVGVFVACSNGTGTGGAASTQSATGSQTAVGPSSTHAATGSAATTTTATTSATVGASSSSGGSNYPKCDQACAHLAQCTGLTCTEVGLDCNAINMQVGCALDCVTTTACSSLTLGTFHSCEVGCASDGGMGFPTSCQACIVFHCGSPLTACAGDTKCMSWLACTNACYQAMPPSPACFTACDNQNSAAAAMFKQVNDCKCSSCGTECQAANPCPAGDGG